VRGVERGGRWKESFVVKFLELQPAEA
jgi:hypothetical protein